MKCISCEIDPNYDHVCPNPLTPVGRLVPWTSEGFVLCCEDCYLHGRPDHVSVVTSHPGASEVCRVNVFPYRGTCRFCDTTLVEPATDRWPELFDGQDNSHYPDPESRVVDLNQEQVSLLKQWVGGRSSR